MGDFLNFLQNLAPEGETILFTHQVPTKETYLDGKVKCVWPATRSIRKIKPGESWYVNSGCFIIDRFKGKVSAAAANCDRVAMLLIDDVGTKVPVPSLPPTWIVESSAGNFQYVYVFSLDGQPTLGEYRAAWAAIAAAGLTDAGADGPVRNIRLPGSVNLKPGRDGFVSQLIEFHPEREFTLPEICAAFGVTPGETQGQRINATLEDNGNDDVLAWLGERGLITERGNSSGWWGVQCPAADEHSDGSSGARYLPSNRSFICYHSHGDKWNSTAFLDWVAGQGGPKHDTGLRDELLAGAMAKVLDKLPVQEYKEGAMFSEASSAQAIIAETELRELGRVSKSEWYDNFAYVMPDDSYFDLKTRHEVPRRSFNAIFAHVDCRSTKGKHPQVSASVCFDENRQGNAAPILAGIAYAPGESVLVRRDGDVYGNRWRDARPKVDAGGDIGRWRAHCERLVPEPEVREHIYNVMAFKLQYPARKINHAVLMGGTPGCGKDLLWAPFIWAVCGAGKKNLSVISDDKIDGQWGYHYECEVLVLNELKEPEARERRALANRLKPVIAAPPDTLTVNRKGLHPYEANNKLFVLSFSNHFAPISIESDDRRWMCVWTHAETMPAGEGLSLLNWYEAGGYAAVAGWLAARDVAAFDNGMRAPMTDWKASMVENSLSLSESAILGFIRGGEGLFHKGAVASPWQAIADSLSTKLGSKVHQNAVLHALRESGWVDMGRIASGELASKKHIYARPDLAESMSKSDLRRLVEPGVPATPDNVTPIRAA